MSIKEQYNMLMTDKYNHGLAETAMCDNCVDSVEDAYDYFLECPKYE